MANVEQVLFWDEQAEKPVCFCPVCGGECYAPGRMCLRCGVAAA